MIKTRQSFRAFFRLLIVACLVLAFAPTFAERVLADDETVDAASQESLAAEVAAPETPASPVAEQPTEQFDTTNSGTNSDPSSTTDTNGYDQAGNATSTTSEDHSSDTAAVPGESDKPGNGTDASSSPHETLTEGELHDSESKEQQALDPATVLDSELDGANFEADDGLEPLAAQSVRLRETNQIYDTLADAMTAAAGASIATYTLEIIGNVVETVDTHITANVTIIAVGGSFTITLTSGFDTSGLRVINGGRLTLGDGTSANQVVFDGDILVLNGYVDVRDGVWIRNTLLLSSPLANGQIRGGLFSGSQTALELEAGAQLDRIIAGTLIGSREAIHLSDSGTKLHLISGGSFYQTDPAATLHGQAVFVQDYAQIGVISGGYFEATRESAIAICRGGWIDAITDGEFYTKNPLCNGAILAQAQGWGSTGIGTISGGFGHGGYIGIWIYGADTHIDYITGGRFEGARGFENDVDAHVTEISGGTFYGTDYGILNVGRIDEYTGTAETIGGRIGIWNYYGSSIGEISGGRISTTGYYATANGISNAGTIELISDGTIIGDGSAVYCTAVNRGYLNVISGGVFWAKGTRAISLAYPVQLEPGISGLRGEGRYQSSSSVIFNDENLVVYPPGYHMSTGTLAVPGITQVEFRYLTLLGPNQYIVTVLGSTALITGAGAYDSGNTVNIDAGYRSGYYSAGWTTADGVSFADYSAVTTSFTMPARDVTVTAVWTRMPGFYIVTVESSAADYTGAGGYIEYNTVIIHAGSHYGMIFTGWSTDDYLVFADASSATTTFQMPARDVTVRANWVRSPGFFFVTVLGSYAANTGAGGYMIDDLVTVYAGTRSGYVFSGWTTGDGVSFGNALSATTVFTMPSRNVMVTANWVAEVGPPPPNPPGSSTGGGSTGGSTGTAKTGDLGGRIALPSLVLLLGLSLYCLTPRRKR